MTITLSYVRLSPITPTLFTGSNIANRCPFSCCTFFDSYCNIEETVNTDIKKLPKNDSYCNIEETINTNIKATQINLYYDTEESDEYNDNII